MSKHYLRIRSRHPSHSFLRRKLKFNKKILVRFGSITPTKLKFDLVINSISGIKNCMDKLKMKEIFTDQDIKQCDWWSNETLEPLDEKMFPIVAKHRFGSRGKGNYKFDTIESFQEFLKKRSNDLEFFIYEKYTSYSREYRLHVSDTCFYTCRKLRKDTTEKENRWKFNNDTCLWILEENPSFNKPDTWDDIVNDCIKAKNALGLTIGACDVRVNKKGKWKIIEINSAPALGELGKKLYLKEINKICAD